MARASAIAHDLVPVLLPASSLGSVVIIASVVDRSTKSGTLIEGAGIIVSEKVEEMVRESVTFCVKTGLLLISVDVVCTLDDSGTGRGVFVWETNVDGEDDIVGVSILCVDC